MEKRRCILLIFLWALTLAFGPSENERYNVFHLSMPMARRIVRGRGGRPDHHRSELAQA
jgi:hypothetical protein